MGERKKSLFSMRKAYCLDFSSLAASSITSYPWMKNILVYIKYAP